MGLGRGSKPRGGDGSSDGELRPNLRAREDGDVALRGRNTPQGPREGWFWPLSDLVRTLQNRWPRDVICPN